MKKKKKPPEERQERRARMEYNDKVLLGIGVFILVCYAIIGTFGKVREAVATTLGIDQALEHVSGAW